MSLMPLTPSPRGGDQRPRGEEGQLHSSSQAAGSGAAASAPVAWGRGPPTWPRSAEGQVGSLHGEVKTANFPPLNSHFEDESSASAAPPSRERNFLEQQENSWSSPAVATSSERACAARVVKASRWTRQEAVEEAEPPGLGEGAQSRPAAESTREEATFPKATPLAQAVPLAGAQTSLTEWDLLLPNCVASAVGSSTGDLELAVEFPDPEAWDCELEGLGEDRPQPHPSPQAPLLSLSWDDELQKPGAQVYMHFMQEHTCYDAMATSSKLVIFDTTLEIKKAFFAMVANGVRAAPLWDSKKQSFVGEERWLGNGGRDLTRCKNDSRMGSSMSLASRPGLPPAQHLSILQVCSPSQTSSWCCTATTNPPCLFEAVYALIKNRIHRLPVLDPVSGTVLYILTHKRLLKFLHIFGALLPRPSFLCRTIQDLGIGTFRDLAVVLETAPILTALDIFVDRRVSALPVVNESGQVVGLYSRFDVIVHRLVLVDETQHLLGVVSLSDILQALVLSPAGIDALSA
ncbi:protein kinase AMP-activated gamma 3 non-catalytic subunit [Cricetulus griseus]